MGRKSEKKGPTSKRYSEAFKQAVVTELQSGRMTSGEAQKRYQIRGAMTIRGWLSRYGKKSPRASRIDPAMKKVTKRKAASKGTAQSERLICENRQLRAALAQVTMEKVLLESLVQEASERLEVDIEKNFGLRR